MSAAVELEKVREELAFEREAHKATKRQMELIVARVEWYPAVVDKLEACEAERNNLLALLQDCRAYVNAWASRDRARISAGKMRLEESNLLDLLRQLDVALKSAKT